MNTFSLLCANIEMITIFFFYIFIYIKIKRTNNTPRVGLCFDPVTHLYAFRTFCCEIILNNISIKITVTISYKVWFVIFTGRSTCNVWQVDIYRIAWCTKYKHITHMERWFQGIYVWLYFIICLGHILEVIPHNQLSWITGQ